LPNNDGKTEKPTPKKLRDARKEGQFARTPDASTWLGIAAGAAMLPRTVGLLADRFRELVALIPQVAQDPSPARALAGLASMPIGILTCVAPLAIAAAAGATLGAAAQGIHPSGAVLRPKLSRMNPKQGVQRMFGSRSIWEAIKGITKVAIIGLAIVVLGRTLVPELVGPGLMPLSLTVQRARSGIQTLLWTAAVTGLLLALADYAYARRTVLKQLRMSPREIKEENRQSEGDPVMKGAIRSRQFAMSRNRMLSAVAEADVVLVNPTHVAVALKYAPDRGAPRVVARGAGTLAAKIRERARENRVPVVEDKPLTRLLYRVCDPGDEIPAELYVAVARILAFVMAAGKPSRLATPRRPTTSTALPSLPSKADLRARRSREARATR
jgi:flagellar biosynthesis protein FlhB